MKFRVKGIFFRHKKMSIMNRLNVWFLMPGIAFCVDKKKPK
jgi:hypothetical protein